MITCDYCQSCGGSGMGCPDCENGLVELEEKELIFALCCRCGKTKVTNITDVCSSCHTKQLIEGADNAHADGYCVVCEQYFVGRKVCGCAAKETL